jgi:hypothetical protein
MDPHYSIQDDAPAAAERKPNYSLFAAPAPSPQKRTFTRLKRPSGVASGVGPASGSTLLSVPAEKAAPPRETLLEAMVKAEPMHPKASTSSGYRQVWWILIASPVMAQSGSAAIWPTSSGQTWCRLNERAERKVL